MVRGFLFAPMPPHELFRNFVAVVELHGIEAEEVGVFEVKGVWFVGEQVQFEGGCTIAKS